MEFGLKHPPGWQGMEPSLMYIFASFKQVRSLGAMPASCACFTSCQRLSSACFHLANVTERLCVREKTNEHETERERREADRLIDGGREGDTETVRQRDRERCWSARKIP